MNILPSIYKPQFYPIIQARLSSKRLPKKILLSISTSDPLISILESLIMRIQKIKNINSKPIIAIPNDEGYDLEKFITKNISNIEISKGSNHNVYERFINAAINLEDSDYIIRLTADNPYLDYLQLEKAILFTTNNNFDLVHSKNLPLGMGFEIIKLSTLRSIKNYNLTNAHKEHVTAYFYQNKDKYNISEFKNTFVNKDIRLTVDEQTDLEMIQKTFHYFKNINHIFFTTNDILDLYESQPHFFDHNRHIYQKSNTESEI